uniref:Uncharacterized protein n=1 Tax=Oryza barthii TaxID=65489 RepID=A0A0D3GYX3_9ORYZ
MGKPNEGAAVFEMFFSVYRGYQAVNGCSSVSDDENSLGLESELEPAVTFKDNSGSPRKDCSSKVESCPLLGTFPERSGLEVVFSKHENLEILHAADFTG